MDFFKIIFSNLLLFLLVFSSSDVSSFLFFTDGASHPACSCTVFDRPPFPPLSGTRWIAPFLLLVSTHGRPLLVENSAFFPDCASETPPPPSPDCYRSPVRIFLNHPDDRRYEMAPLPAVPLARLVRHVSFLGYGQKFTCVPHSLSDGSVSPLSPPYR